MTAWDIELELNVPTNATGAMVKKLRDTLADNFIPNALFVDEFTIDGLEWHLTGRLPYEAFNQLLEIIATAHQEFSFMLCYNSDDLLSTGHVLWADGKMIVHEFQENLTYDQYRACGLDEYTWLMTYAHDEDEWWELVNDADTSTLLLNELHEFLLDEHGLDDDNEILQAIAEHPNYAASHRLRLITRR